MARRIAALGKVLGNLMAEGSSVPLDPPLQRVSKSGTFLYNRSPLAQVDGGSWRRSLQEAEVRTLALALQGQMALVDVGLADWIRSHKYLRPVPPEEGESGVALLYLWEVEKGHTFPSRAGGQ